MMNGKGIIYYAALDKFWVVDEQKQHKQITEHEYRMYRAMKENELKKKIES